MVQYLEDGYICIPGNSYTYKISFTKQEPSERFRQVKYENRDIRMEEFDYLYVSNIKEFELYLKDILSAYKYDEYRELDNFYKFSNEIDNEWFVDIINQYKYPQNQSETYTSSGSGDSEAIIGSVIGIALLVLLGFFIFNPKLRNCIVHGGGFSCNRYLNVKK
jgi:hypothetical protein